jgi:hypothetical protein
MPDPTPEAFPQALLGFPFTPVDPQGWSSPRASLLFHAETAITATSFSGPTAAVPAPNALLIAVVSHRTNNAASDTLTLWGLTWTQILRHEYDGPGNDCHYVLVARSGAGIPGGEVFTITASTGSPIGFGFQVWQFLGADSTFVPSIRQLTAGDANPSTAPHFEFPWPTLTGSAVLALESNDNNTAVTPPSGFTEIFDTPFNSNQHEGAILYPETAPRTAVTWGNSIVSWGTIGIEVQMDPFPTGLDPVSKSLDPMGSVPPSLLYPTAPPQDYFPAAAPPDDGYIATTEVPHLQSFDPDPDPDYSSTGDQGDEARLAGPDIPETWAAFDIPQEPSTFVEPEWFDFQTYPDGAEDAFIAGPPPSAVAPELVAATEAPPQDWEWDLPPDPTDTQQTYDNGTPEALFLITDSFNRADNSGSLLVADCGRTWIAQHGTWGTIGNKGYLSAVPNQSSAVLDMGIADIDLVCDITFGTAEDNGLVFRAADDNNYLLFANNDAGGVSSHLYKRSGGSFTDLGVFPTPNLLSATHTFRIYALGPDIAFFIDGVQVFATTLSAADQAAYGANTKHGLRIHIDNGDRFDNLNILAAAPGAVENLTQLDPPDQQILPEEPWIYDQVHDGTDAFLGITAGAPDDGYIAAIETPDQIAWPEPDPDYSSTGDFGEEAVAAGPDVPETWAAFDVPQFPETWDDTDLWNAWVDQNEGIIAGPPNFAPDEVMAAQLDPPQDIGALFPDPDPTNDQPFLDFCEAQIAGPDIVETWAAFDVPDQRYDEETPHPYEALFNDGTDAFLGIPQVLGPEIMSATDPVPMDLLHFPDPEVDWQTPELDITGYLFPPPVVVGTGGRLFVARDLAERWTMTPAERVRVSEPSERVRASEGPDRVRMKQGVRGP